MSWTNKNFFKFVFYKLKKFTCDTCEEEEYAKNARIQRELLEEIKKKQEQETTQREEFPAPRFISAMNPQIQNIIVLAKRFGVPIYGMKIREIRESLKKTIN